MWKGPLWDGIGTERIKRWRDDRSAKSLLPTSYVTVSGGQFFGRRQGHLEGGKLRLPSIHNSRKINGLFVPSVRMLHESKSIESVEWPARAVRLGLVPLGAYKRSVAAEIG